MIADHNGTKIPMSKQKGGGVTSRNYYKCDLKIRNLFSSSKLYWSTFYPREIYWKQLITITDYVFVWFIHIFDIILIKIIINAFDIVYERLYYQKSTNNKL